MQKKLILAFFATALLALPQTAAARQNAAATITFLVGQVLVSQKGGSFAPADYGAALGQGDTIKTGEDSSCEITLAGGSILRMDSNSEHELGELPQTGKDGAVAVFSRAGRLWAAVKRVSEKNEEFVVSTDKAVCAVRGTVFDVTAGKATTSIAVFDGQVAAWAAMGSQTGRPANSSLMPGRVSAPQKVSGPQRVSGPQSVSMEKWVEIVSAMQKISIDAQGGFEKSDIEQRDIENDPWVKWNMERDRSMGR